MRLTLIIPILLISNFIALAQPIKKAELVGKWHLIKLTTDSIVVFDADSLEYFKQKNLNLLKEIKPNYTKEDSIRLVEQYYNGVEDVKKIYFQFNSNNTYSNIKIKGGGKLTDEVEEGKYKLIRNENKLILVDHLERKSECSVKKVGNVLILTFVFGPKTIEMQFVK